MYDKFKIICHSAFRWVWKLRDFRFLVMVESKISGMFLIDCRYDHKIVAEN